MKKTFGELKEGDKIYLLYTGNPRTLETLVVLYIDRYSEETLKISTERLSNGELYHLKDIPGNFEGYILPRPGEIVYASKEYVKDELERDLKAALDDFKDYETAWSLDTL